MAEHFKLGFSNRSLNYYLQDKNRVEGLRQRGRPEEFAVFREKSGHERSKRAARIVVTGAQLSQVI
jgi:hypothetical protein